MQSYNLFQTEDSAHFFSLPKICFFANMQIKISYQESFAFQKND